MNVKNVVWQQHNVTKAQRSSHKKQRSTVVWFTGLSGSGKSTIASAVEQKLFNQGYHTYLLDGDNVRHGLNSDLGFSDSDRAENIRRISEVAKLFTDAGLIVLTAFISPFHHDRRMARNLMEAGEFIEAYMETPLDICEQRDPKGFYKKVRNGEIKHFTGIDSVYEPPQHAEITINTAQASIEQCADQVIQYLKDNAIIG